MASPLIKAPTAVVQPTTSPKVPLIEIDGLSLYYGGNKALKNISLKVCERIVTALIGPSGCGKSTLLRCINRMNDLIESVRIDGDMLLNGESIYGPHVDVIDLRKRRGMVFQRPNPFPMSIFENVVYPLLDEPCSALDPIATSKVEDLVQE